MGKAGGKVGSCSTGADDGESCKSSSECDGYTGLGQKGSACCNNKCRALKKDYAGVYDCRNECKSGSFASPGSCK